MGYVVYHRVATRLIMNNREFATERGAKIALSRFCNREGLDKGDFAIIDADIFYQDIEKSVERVNLMTGEKYMEKANTPPHLSPAYETYWSM